jgi:anti-sigma factor RsiW
MNEQLQTQLQAWIDGELDARAAQDIAQRVQHDPEARALCDNLRAIRNLLRGHEPGHAVTETREFYWSKIRRGITAAAPPAPEPAAPSRPAFDWSWLAWFIPATALIVAAFIYLPFGKETPTRELASSAPPMVEHEIEAADVGLTSFTFYSSEDAMTIVWLGHSEDF